MKDENEVDESTSGLEGEGVVENVESAVEGVTGNVVEGAIDASLSTPIPDCPVLKDEDGSEALDNVRWEKFCHGYVRCGVLRAAAINAGFSRASANVIGSKLVRNPVIRNRINYLKNCVGWSLEKTKYEVDDGYRQAKKANNLRERREFARFMAELMGYGRPDPVSAMTGFMGQIGNILTIYHNKYQNAPVSGQEPKIVDITDDRQPDTLPS